jgi:hypothetical protein
LANTAAHAYGAILGGCANRTGTGTLSGLGMCTNTTSFANDFATVLGGTQNQASGIVAAVSGGDVNLASGPGAAISGGGGNTVSGGSASVTGGQGNTAKNNFSAIDGGQSNTTQGDWASITGGQFNLTTDPFSSITGGCLNALAAQRRPRVRPSITQNRGPGGNNGRCSRQAETCSNPNWSMPASRRLSPLP